MATYQGALVCGEVIEGKLTTGTRELLNMGRRLCDHLNQPLSTLLIGKNIQGAAAELIPLGTDKGYIANGPPFAESHPDLYVAIMTEACKQIAPSIILFGHTEMGREVASRLASRLRTTVTMDCTAPWW